MAAAPEQVRQEESQDPQAVGEDLNWFEAQLMQLPDERILAESEQLRQFEEDAPEQVAQSEWQFVQVVSEALNWLLVQAVQLPGVGLAEFTFPATRVMHWSAFPPLQLEQSAWQL